MKLKEEELSIINFSSLSEEKARTLLGLKLLFNDNDLLETWLQKAKTITVSEEETKQLNRLRKKLSIYVRGWNEQELRERFIIPVIEIVDFDMPAMEIASFAEREMKTVYKNFQLQGKVEWMVAKGIFEPQKPFFFIHEYKREKDAANDPVGQLLTTLFAAQLLNNQPDQPNLFNQDKAKPIVPMYGSYIMGRFWYFLRLKDTEYYISKAYDSTDKEDLNFILKMLKAQKEMIINLFRE